MPRRWRREMPACSASPISIRRNFAARRAIPRRRSTSTIRGCSRPGRASMAWRSRRPQPPGAAAPRALPAWLQRAVTPFKPLLRPLARKIGLSPRLDAQAENILLAQIEDFRPDLISTRTPSMSNASLMRRIKGIGNPILIGMVGIEPSRGEDWTGLRSDDVAIVHHREFLSKPRGSRRSESPRLRTRHPRRLAGSTGDGYRCFVRRHGVAGPPAAHRVAGGRRRTLRSQIVGKPPAGACRQSSPLHRCFQGEVWGADMYQVLRRSRVTLNSHIDLAGREAGNMRLFEATGVGAFLLTDFKDNLHTLFEPDREVAVWRSIDDCLEAIGRALADDNGRAAIARAGQARTMAQHTYRHRTRRDSGVCRKRCGRHDEASPYRQADRRSGSSRPRRSCAVIFCPRPTIGCSAAWTKRDSAAASSGGWLAARTVTRQERAYQGLIAAMKRGEPRLDFKVAAEAVAATGIANPRAARGRLRQRLLFGGVCHAASRRRRATPASTTRMR